MSRNRLFAKRGNTHPAGSVAALREELSGLVTGEVIRDKSVTAAVISTESFKPEQELAVHTATSTFESEIIKAAKAAGFTEENGYALEDHAIEAATMAAVLSADPRAVYTSKLREPSSVSQYINQAADGSTAQRLISVESYDEKPFAENAANTIMYNLLASQQDEFSADFFPILLIETGVAGVEIETHVTYVYNDFIHSTTGSLANLERKDVLKAYVHDEILENDLTAAIPVYRPTGSGANAGSFVDPAIVPVSTYDFGSGIKAETLPLTIEKEHNLIGLSQTNKSLVSGVANYTDTLSHVVELKYLFVTDGEQTYKIDCGYKPGARFNIPLQGDTRRVTLDFATDDITLRRGTKTVLGEDGISDEFFDSNVRLSFRLNGSVLLDRGTTSVYGASIGFVNATDENGDLVDEATAETLTEKVAELKVVGYILKAFKTNENLRHLGQLVEDKSYLMFARVPYHSPMSIISTTYDGQRDDNTAIARLVTLTNLNSSNRSVKRVLDIIDYLRDYVSVPDADGNDPLIDIVGSRYMRPTLYEEELSVNEILDGLTSTNRNEDFGNALINRLRTAGLDLLERSEILPAGRFITGNQNFKPTLVVGTDIQIGSYLRSEFGDKVEFKEFDLRFSTTLNKRLRGKLVFSFTNLNKGEAASKVTPFTPGVFVSSPELVSSMPRTIDGQTSNYLIVTPRNLHLWTQPVFGQIELRDLPDVSVKLKYFVENVGAVNVVVDKSEEAPETP